MVGYGAGAPLSGGPKSPAQELLSVPYHAITSVVLSSTSAQQHRKVGFALG